MPDELTIDHKIRLMALAVERACDLQRVKPEAAPGHLNLYREMVAVVTLGVPETPDHRPGN